MRDGNVNFLSASLFIIIIVLEVTMRDGNLSTVSVICLNSLSFRSDYEGWKRLPLLEITIFEYVLEVTMRDGNIKLKNQKDTFLETAGFRSDYEGWKLIENHRNIHSTSCQF